MTNNSEEAEPSSLLTLRILETIVGTTGDWGVTELAVELGITRGRAHRYLAQLRAHGYLAQSEETRRYRPGWRLIMLAQSGMNHADLVTIARPTMRALRDRLQCTIVLSELTPKAVTPVVVMPGGSPIDAVMLPGTRFGYNSSAQGKVALAYANAEQKLQWNASVNDLRTPKTIRDPEVLWREIGIVRGQGWAVAPEETFTGVNTIAAPVFANGGVIRATLAAVASITDLPQKPPARYVDELLRATKSLSSLLGGDSKSTDEEVH